MTRLFFAFVLLIAVALPQYANAIETSAKQAYLVDFDTGAVLLNKDGQAKMHPSSMSKLMTTHILFEQLKKGKLKLTDTFRVSEKAWRKEGSKMFVKVNTEVSIEDLIRGIVVQSGNDACIVVAEGISGSEEAFAKRMNRTARKLGLKKSHFVNSTGWPDDKHQMSAEDLATLAGSLIRSFPKFYHYYGEDSFTYNGIKQPNRNRLLGGDLGVDGLKTGHTEVAGYGITLSAKDPKTGRRLILVINGMESEQGRIDEGARLLRWGFRNFENHTVAKKGAKIADVPVWMGKQETVSLSPRKDIQLTMPLESRDQVKFVLNYDGPVQAPIKKGARLALLTIKVPDMPDTKIPLFANDNVEKVTGLSKVFRNIKALVTQSRSK